MAAGSVLCPSSVCVHLQDRSTSRNQFVYVACQFDLVCVSRLCSGRLRYSFRAAMHVVYGWALWQQLCEMATDESRSLLSYGPSRPGVRNMCELKLHFQ